jgi:hypothetical protein
MPPKVKKGKGKKKKQVEEEVSDNIPDDDDLLNMEANQQTDQEDLTPEQKEAMVYKKLTSNNPQAPQNITKFSYNDRYFKADDTVDQIVWHYSCDGDILMADAEEFRDQQDYLDEKKRQDDKALAQMNSAINAEWPNEKSKWQLQIQTFFCR